MYREGQIIYFTPFYFKNGNPAKDKYFVVLKNNGSKGILAGLPTRRDNIPAANTPKHGCVELPRINLNCFVISPDIEVTESGNYFDFPTHLYGHQLDIHEIEQLEENYKIEGSDYEIWGQMKSTLFEELKDCLKNSKIVKRKYKRLLSK